MALTGDAYEYVIDELESYQAVYGSALCVFALLLTVTTVPDVSPPIPLDVNVT